MGRNFYVDYGLTSPSRIYVERHVYRESRPISGADFLAIEREARAQLAALTESGRSLGGGVRRKGRAASLARRPEPAEGRDA